MIKSIKTLYKEEVVKSLIDEFNYKNVHEVPKLLKITVNRGLGEASRNAKLLESSINELAIITGQKPLIASSKKAIAGFKVRENMPVGIFVTLRKDRMYSFLERLIHLVLPRMKDFRGISVDKFDGKGNYNLGFEEQLVFPELKYDEVLQAMGMDITLVTSAKSDEEAYKLLGGLGMPFQKKEA